MKEEKNTKQKKETKTMKTNKTVSYALACLKALAMRFGEFLQVAEIAASQNIPAAYCQKILLALAKTGMVESVKGRGFVLVRPVEEISTLEVVKALAVEEHGQAEVGREMFSSQTINDALTARLNKVLSELSVAELVH